MKLTKFARDYIRSQGAIPATIGYDIGFPIPPYPAATYISVNEEIVHGIPRKDKIIKNGDIISLDDCINLDGYFGDSAYTFAIGEIDEKSKRLIEVTKRSKKNKNTKRCCW